MTAAKQAQPDCWQSRFEPPKLHNAGAGVAYYRRCTRCGNHAMEGALSAHARWCDKQHAARTLAAFDQLGAEARRERLQNLNDVRIRAKGAL